VPKARSRPKSARKHHPATLRAKGSHVRLPSIVNTGEEYLVQKLRRAARTKARETALRVGIGDDAALFTPRSGYETVLTCDWFLQGTHFLTEKHPPESIGWKCLARAVSDVAAMGGQPQCFLLSLALPASYLENWLDAFLRGLRRAAHTFGCRLAGGDTTRRDNILINVTVVGEVRAGRAVLRAGARPKDAIFVSGQLGEAAFGLQLVRAHRQIPSHSRNVALQRHFYPEPRVALGRWLSEKRLATAMIDISDGLSTDLARLCEASRVGAKITGASIPMPRAFRLRKPNRLSQLKLALHGGDDYELLFTVPNRQTSRIPDSFRGLPLSRIGVISNEQRLRLVDFDGRERTLPAYGWDPFRG
jgi:thiamine-monophosphate kinase